MKNIDLNFSRSWFLPLLNPHRTTILLNNRPTKQCQCLKLFVPKPETNSFKVWNKNWYDNKIQLSLLWVQDYGYLKVCQPKSVHFNSQRPKAPQHYLNGTPRGSMGGCLVGC